MSCFSSDQICYRTIFEHIPIAGFLVELDKSLEMSLRSVHCNKECRKKFDTIDVDFFSGDIFNDLRSAVKRSLETNNPQSLESVVKNKKEAIYLRITVNITHMSDIKLVSGVMENTTSLVKAKIELHDKNKVLENLNYELASSKLLIDQYIPISSTDLQGIITDCNEAFCNLTGYSKEDLVGKNHNIIKDHETPKEVYKDFWKVIVNNETYIGELKNRKKDGTPFWIRTRVHPMYEKNGKKVGYISVREDITNAKHLEEKASVDALTKVFNRNKFNDFITKELAEFHRYSKVSSLIMCDIDHFKSVNDRYGHLVGDEILKEVVDEIKSSIRDSDILARWGGEEFIILLPNTSEKNAIIVANKIVRKIENRKFKVVGNITMSCGVSEVTPNDTLNVWFKRVDDALYKAKDRGRNRVVYL